MMIRRSLGTILSVAPLLVAIALAQDGGPNGAGFSEADLDTLLAPIALYPDPLLAQLLPAATFPDQLKAAADWLARNPGNTAGIDDQPWDISVKAIAHYPSVIKQLDDDPDWTLSLGQAFAVQPKDVNNSIQQLRARARTAGALADSPQQKIIMDQEAIEIVPANPQFIYVPQYNPQVVYVDRPDETSQIITGLVSFGAGLAVGAWLNNSFDWHGRYGWGVHYHGWSGPGWWGPRPPPFIGPRNIYINNSYRNRRWGNPGYYNNRNIIINRTYITRNQNRYNFNQNRPGPDNRFRPGPNRPNGGNNQNRPNPGGGGNQPNRPNFPGGGNQPNRPSQPRPNTRPATPRPAPQRPAQQRPAPQRPSGGGFGGYDRGSRSQAESSRGRASAGARPAPAARQQRSAPAGQKGRGR